MTVTGTTVPRPAPGLVERDLPDGLLVFDPTRLRAHALNPSAAWVLARCDGRTEVHAMVAELVAELADRGLAAEVLDRDVREAVEQLGREGVLDIGAGWPAPEPARPFTNVPHTGIAVGAEEVAGPWAFTSPAYAGLDVRFRFSTDDPDLAGYLAAILDPLAVAPPAVADAADAVTERHYVLRPPDGTDPGLVALDGFEVARPGTDHLLAATVLWHVNQLVSTTSRTLWQLHASGIVRGGHAVVFPASMNSGKSTLVAGLVRAGDAYLTDETIAIEPDTGVVIPYPKAIALDPGSWPVLPALAPQLDPAWQRFEHVKWHVDPRATGAPLVTRATRTTVGAVIFPTYRPDAPTALEPMGATEAAAELCRHSFNLAVLGSAGIDAAVALARRVPCHRLFVQDLDRAVQTVHRHVDGLAVAPLPGPPAHTPG